MALIQMQVNMCNDRIENRWIRAKVWTTKKLGILGREEEGRQNGRGRPWQMPRRTGGESNLKVSIANEAVYVQMRADESC